MDLLKSHEINLDYILELIFHRQREGKDKAELIEKISRVISASFEQRAKEPLMIRFIRQANLASFTHKNDVIDSFY